jgi:hypothetical protein
MEVGKKTKVFAIKADAEQYVKNTKRKYGDWNIVEGILIGNGANQDVWIVEVV